jgi:transcriptional regulator with XRE-family HTH domain
MDLVVIMIADMFITPSEMRIFLAKKVQEKRLSLNLSQKTLSERSGVSFGVIKKFELTGKISLESLLKISLVLGCLRKFEPIFNTVSPEEFPSLDVLLKDKPRKRGRQ